MLKTGKRELEKRKIVKEKKRYMYRGRREILHISLFISYIIVSFLCFIIYRYIALVATDNDEALSLQGTLVVTFDRTCTEYSMGRTIQVPSKLSDDRLTVCTAISGLTLEFDGVANLSSLVNVQVLIIACT